MTYNVFGGTLNPTLLLLLRSINNLIFSWLQQFFLALAEVSTTDFMTYALFSRSGGCWLQVALRTPGGASLKR